MIRDTHTMHNVKKQKGAGLLEIMVTLAVVAFGVVGIIYLQGEFSTQSANNKARVEAIAYAEEKIEAIRSYAASPEAAYFDASFITGLATSFDATPESLSGTNADFTRVTQITDDTEITVTVSWTDRNSQSQSIEVKTDISWESPGLAASILTASDSETYMPPTGIAVIGEGKLTDLGDDDTSPSLLGSQDDDGIAFYEFDGSLYLVDTNVPDGEDDIVMTLPEICGEDSSFPNCADNVVTINGRVYLDENSPFDVSEVKVKSSDVTYCTQFNVDQTANGDYRYFDYRCYASFGWYGNIGLVLDPGYSSSTRVCQGDPTLVDPAFEYVYGQPVLSPRRVYRGMYYQEDTNTDSGKTERDGIPLYWSVGVGAGTNLGLMETGVDVNGDPVFEPYHNFLIGNNGGDTSTPRSTDPADFCTETVVMLRDDSIEDVDGLPVRGQLFAGNHDDFYCLNPHVDETSLDLGTFSIDEDCPFDPSSPPVLYYLITGGLSLDDFSTGTVSLDSSLDPATCEMSSTDYSCEIYDWGGGWTGYIQVNTDDPDTLDVNESESIACNYDRIYLVLPESDSGTEFPSETVNCSQGSASIVRGNISLLDDDYPLLETDDSGAAVPAVSIVSATGPEGNCSYLLSSTYSCVTDNFAPADGWNGMLIVNTDGYVCDSYGLDANNELVRDDAGELVINGGGVFLLGEDELLTAGEIKLHDMTITAPPRRPGDVPRDCPQ